MVILVLAGTLGLVLVTPQSILREETTTTTTTVTSTATPTQQVVNVVEGSFAQHLVLFTTRNVSGIVSQYEPNANVTWENLSCFSGIYSNQSSITLLLNVVFGYKPPVIGSPLAPYGFSLANVTQTRITALTNGSVLVNSSFGLVAQHAQGNFTDTVSAQDLYSYSEASGTWLISQESWHFLSSYTPSDVICVITAFGPRR